MVRRAGVALASVALLLAAGAASSRADARTTVSPIQDAQTSTIQAEAAPQAGQAPRSAAEPVTICNQTAAPPDPEQLPGPDSPPVLWLIAPCFEAQGGESLIDPQTYVHYIQTLDRYGSRPSQGQWTPWSDEVEESLLGDFRRLWNTGFLDNLSIEVEDFAFANGVIGRVALLQMEEQERVKIVDYDGTDVLNRTDIDDALRQAGTTIRLDAFINQADIRQVEGVIRSMLAEKGHPEGTVTHSITPLAMGPKLVHLTFNIDDGPRVRIAQITFRGNDAMSDRQLRGKMEHNKQPGFFRFIGIGGSNYKEEMFEEDAQRIVAYYRERGYLKASVGQPEIRPLDETHDGRRRKVELLIPVTEGRRYQVGTLDFAENTVVKADALRPLFRLGEGDYYNEKHIRDGIEKAQELYGTGGYFEFTAYPEFDFQDVRDPQAAPVAANTDPEKPAVVDVTMHMDEGDQYLVNKITFRGNTVTRDHVIRREIRLLENHVFNTEALKYSVRRINQLGYFTPLEGEDDVQVEKTPGETGRVDVTLRLQEQNRNQVTFGAGASQFEGVFGQLAFQTANFMGRGETVSLMLAAGSRSSQYQVALTQPYMFDRPITGGFDIYNRRIQFPGAFTQRTTGGNLVFGFPVADFTRQFIQYSYQQVRVLDLNPLYSDFVEGNPFMEDALLMGEDGKRVISKVTPTLQFDTIDNPIFPNFGKRARASVDVAGLGGNVKFVKPMLEGTWWIPHTGRTTIGLHSQLHYIMPYGSSIEREEGQIDPRLPIFERLWLGGEYSVRGFDYRTIGPRDDQTGVLIGGNKSLLVNAEYAVRIADPVRLVFFYDAGQVRDFGEQFRLSEFKTSTGAEVRFFMPILNVPFRLIFAYNPQRSGVLDNNFQPQREFTFRFAVGSQF